MTAMPPKNIVFVLPAMTAGGAERVLITLMNGLDRGQYSPALVSFSDEGPMADLIDDDIPFHCLFSTVKTGLPLLYKKLKTMQPDIIVSTMAHTNFAVLLLKRLFPDTKFVVREAITPSFILRRHPRLAPLIKLAYKTLYRSADLVISPAQAIIDEFAALGMKTDHHKVLPNPVDSEKIRAAPLPRRDDDTTTEFICAGRLHHQKGYDRLFEILPFVSIPKWHLTILGEGPERRRLEIQARREAVTEKVDMAGHIDTPWPYIAAADCLLLPSRWEGLPNVVLESLAAGTPVIAMAEAGGIDEIAKAAAPGTVTVVETMDEFLTAMNKVEHNPAAGYRPSLLPPSFEKPAIQEKFSQMLEAL
ncbi:MAG: glycosyltransferase [Rhodospirillales bacterium]|nr:glycosyltransferase [Rhodospirillales bacterium]MCB9994928.1 glycosyltransferase [Rhodospirillales bacterium]